MGADVADGARLSCLFSHHAPVEVRRQQQPILHGHLLHSVHLVRFAPGVIELRPEPQAPRDFAAALAKLLLETTGQRWTIALSQAEGEPTLAAQGMAADAARRSAVAEHPLVRAILDAFPGANIDSVTDSRTDAYGLLSEPNPDFPDPEFADPDLSPTMEDDL
ncbi:MAG: hypothetical protein NVS2B11_05790 [Acetobacteraceae bacterium]